jgi:hypothetical protein
LVPAAAETIKREIQSDAEKFGMSVPVQERAAAQAMDETALVASESVIRCCEWAGCVART